MTTEICVNPRIENSANMRTDSSSPESPVRGVATGAPAQKKNRGRPKIGKIPVELRRSRIRFSSERNPVKRFLWRLRDDSQFLRQTVQSSFVLLCIWIGIEFYLFVQWGMSGGEVSFFPRPPGAEGFLPISALISLTYWLRTGIINEIHPAGLFILIAIVVMSIALKKAFCSWMCPVGTLSEALWMLGKKLFGRTLTLPKWLDYPLRSLKYLLLLFFCWSIWRLDAGALYAFIASPYNKVADVKMYLFFTQISAVALWSIVVLMMLSVMIKNFWCRFLCPYGALLGIAGMLSPLKVTRNKETCVDCELCTRACPAGIAVHKTVRVWSDECMSCLACVDVCPVKETLEVKAKGASRALPVWAYGALVAGVFVAVTGLSILTGHWRNSISHEEYLQHFQHIDSYDHLR